jgi:phospholipid/cholesterol/gamma-HCH transport system substrate-binding protein
MSKSNRRNDVTTEIVVGAFMFTILVVLLTITVVISQNKFFEKTYPMVALFPDVGGLKEGENVYLRGVKVGNVNSIQVSDEKPGVEVRLVLDRPVTLYEDYQLMVESSSLLGGMRLVIDEGSRDAEKVDPDTYSDLTGNPAPDLMGTANRMLEDIREVTRQISSGEGTIGKLVYDESLYDEANALVTSLGESAKRLEEVSENAKLVTDRIAQGKGSLGKLLSEDESLYNNLTNTLHQINLASEDARTIMERVEKGEGTIGKLLSPDDQVYQDLKDTVASLKKFSKNLGEQQGTVGRLINEDTLYVKIEGLVDEARATIDDFRETSPITTFSTIFFGAF